MSMIPREQSETLNIIRRYVAERGRAPFQYEIGIHLGTKSRGVVRRMLSEMAEQGLIRWHKFSPGGIELMEDATQHRVTLNSEISRLVSDYARSECRSADTIVNAALRDWFGAAA